MNTTKKTKLGKFAAMLMLTAALAACGKGNGPSGVINTDAIDVNVDTRGVKITMWTGFGSDMTEQLNEVLEDFMQLTGITVEHESKGGYDNLLKAINLSATQGSYPNIANGYPDHFASYIKSNILLRLDGLLANDANRFNYEKKGTKYDKDGIMLMNYQDFYKDYTVENETLEFKEDGTGFIDGVPFNKSTEVMVYNSTFFDWAIANKDIAKNLAGGVEIKVPETWADVKTVGMAINTLCKPLFKTANGDGKILGSDGQAYDSTDACVNNNAEVVINMSAVTEEEFRPFTYDAQANMFITLVRQYGGQFTEVDKTATGKGYAVFNNPQAIEAMKMVQDLFDNNVLGIPAKWNELYCSTPFKAYKSFMNISSTAGLKNVDNNNFKVKCTHIPYKDADHKFVISQGTSLGLFDKGSDAERVASWKLMVYLSQQANGKFAAATGYFPTCDFAFNSDEYFNYQDSSLKSSVDILRQASSKVNSDEYVGNKWTKFVDPGFRGSADIRAAAELIPGYLMTNTYSSVEETLSEVEKTIIDYVKA